MTCSKLLRQMPGYNEVAEYLRPITKMPGYATAAKTVSKYPGETISLIGLGIAYWAKSYQLAFISTAYLSYRAFTHFSDKKTSKTVNTAMKNADGSGPTRSRVSRAATSGTQYRSSSKLKDLAQQGQQNKNEKVRETSSVAAGRDTTKTHSGAKPKTVSVSTESTVASHSKDTATAKPQEPTSKGRARSGTISDSTAPKLSGEAITSTEQRGLIEARERVDQPHKNEKVREVSSDAAGKDSTKAQSGAKQKTVSFSPELTPDAPSKDGTTAKTQEPTSKGRTRSGTISGSTPPKLSAVAITSTGQRVLIEALQGVAQPQDLGNSYSRPSGSVSGDPSVWSDT